MPLNIVQLGPYPPPEGGVSRNMLAIRDAATRRGDICTIIATAKSTRRDGAQNVHHPGSALALLRLLATLKFDVVHLHVGGEITARVMALALAVTVFGRGRCVLTVHSGAFPLSTEAKSASSGSFRGRVFLRFSKVIAVSQTIADVFRRHGLQDDKVKVILPFALSAPDPNVEITADLTEFVEKHSPVLLSVGGLEKDYEPLFQISAMKAILQEYPDAGLLLIGDGSMRKAVEARVEASGISGNIMIAGNVEHASVLHLLTKADVLLRTTLFDGDAISVREALHLGTPVIATNNGMRPEGVELIEIGDESGLMEKVRLMVAKRKPSEMYPTTDTTNIDAVLALYDEISRPTQT